MKVLVDEQAKEKLVEISKALKPLVTKFKEILHGELPEGLPSMRDGRHQIWCRELAFQICHITEWALKRVRYLKRR